LPEKKRAKPEEEEGPGKKEIEKRVCSKGKGLSKAC